MEASEGDAVINFITAVGDVERVQRRREPFAEIFPQSQIECRVLRKIISGIGLSGKGVGESRPVINIGGRVGAVRQSKICADVERVSLVVIQRSPGKERKVGESASEDRK